MRLRTAAAGIALMASGLVLSAAGNAHAQTIGHAPKATHGAAVSPLFATLCSGDVCIKTTSKNLTTASVNAWANYVSFTGHFELLNCGHFVANSTEGFWPSGRDPYPFGGLHWADCNDKWTVIGWQRNSPGNYTKIGTVNFSI